MSDLMDLLLKYIDTRAKCESIQVVLGKTANGDVVQKRLDEMRKELEKAEIVFVLREGK